MLWMGMDGYGWAHVGVVGYALGMGTNSKENIGLWCEVALRYVEGVIWLVFHHSPSCIDLNFNLDLEVCVALEQFAK